MFKGVLHKFIPDDVKMRWSKTKLQKMCTCCRSLDLGRKIKHCVDRDTVVMLFDLFCKASNSASQLFGQIHGSAKTHMWDE